MDIHGTLGLQQEGIPIGRPHASAIFSLMQHPRRIGNPRAKLLEGPTLPSSNNISDELIQDSIHQSLPEMTLDQLPRIRLSTLLVCLGRSI